MPTYKQTTVETIDREVRTTYVKSCCNAWDVLQKAYHLVASADGRGVTFQNGTMTCCPYCGERIVIDTEITLPKGYMKKP